MPPQEQEDIHISERELDAMTGDLVAAQDEHLPAMERGAQECSERAGGLSRRPLSWRGFLATAGSVVGAGLVLAAAGPAAASGVTTRPRAAQRSRAAPLDVTVAALAASLENPAVATYTAGLKEAGVGKLGTVPPAVATFATTARSQHARHAAAWNSIVRAAGVREIKVVDPVVGRVENADFARVKKLTGPLELALTLENVAAATCLEAIEAVSSPAAISVAASIQPVEMQHAAILNVVLGRDPVPAAFAVLDGAVALSDAKHLAISRA